MSQAFIPFTRPYVTPREEEYLLDSLRSGILQGDGPMTKAATRVLLEVSGAERALLTTSCTHALEMSAMLLDLGPGDEVLVPSFTFSSTAGAVAIRGATPVFVDIDPLTLNLDVQAAEAAVTDRTRAVFVVHYGGIGADIPALLALADRHGLAVVEDNAHGLGARRGGYTLGTVGAMATQSFHSTKNVQCGEGGALLVNDASFFERAEVLREKGTDRSRFLRGQVDKYTWNDVGSSYLPSDLLCAVLLSQLESFDLVQRLRHEIWDAYQQSLGGWASANGARLMHVPDDAQHPAHVFYLIMATHEDQTALLTHLRERAITGTFHYVPLDSSPAGRRFGRTPSPCDVTADLSARLVRLPLYAGMTQADVDRVLDAVTAYVARTPVAAG
ncbi:dTDP-4-amino-4,6-dideoxygalactose transaminase [Angustibacter sp. McL0619]|uniref:dTDP-4-amino-4,6-dideoxygalactose transaminase n=1 Tax=Angustibacter sp. McL0619 TaxID=3415676 RepID=UPI003CF6BE86